MRFLFSPIPCPCFITEIVFRLGAEVQGITVGELYAIWDVVPCALAHPSTALSPAFQSIGLGKNGGFAEYIVVNQAELVPVVSMRYFMNWEQLGESTSLQPQGLAPEVACLAADSLITVYNAVHNVAQVRPQSVSNNPF